MTSGCSVVATGAAGCSWARLGDVGWAQKFFRFLDYLAAQRIKCDVLGDHLELDRVCTFIDLMLSSSSDPTVRAKTAGDSDVLTLSFFPVAPLFRICGASKRLTV